MESPQRAFQSPKTADYEAASPMYLVTGEPGNLILSHEVIGIIPPTPNNLRVDSNHLSPPAVPPPYCLAFLVHFH